MDPDNNEYATPPEIWRPLSRAVGGFDLDAASGAESTPIAPDRLTKEDDGLSCTGSTETRRRGAVL